MRLALLFILAFFVATQSGYAQRVYADAQQVRTGFLGGNVQNAGNTTDTNYENFSTLNVGIGALSLMFTTQNLQFTTLPPQNTSPIIIRFSTTRSTLDLIGGISIQRTRAETNLVGTNYTSSALLSLLAPGTIQEAIIPSPGSSVVSDGVRLNISTVLGLGLSAQLYYAFYITPPTLSANTISLCQGATTQIQITNRQVYNNVPYTYRLYTAEVGGTEVAGVTASTTSTLNIPASLPAGTYWVEARESDLYPSARVSVTINRNPLPVLNIGSIPNICEGDNSTFIPFTVGATAPNQYQITWNSGTPTGFTNVPWTNLPTTGAQLPVPIPTTASMGEYSGILQTQTATGCVGAEIPFTVRIRPTAGKPHMTITEVVN